MSPHASDEIPHENLKTNQVKHTPQVYSELCECLGHLAPLTMPHLIGVHPSCLTKERTTCTMDPSPKTIGLQHPRH